jgi:hypothetical protein
MIIPELHRQPVAVNLDKHKTTALAVPVTDWRTVPALNAVFVSAAEMPQIAGEYAIFFINAGQNGQGGVDYAPIAVLGLAKGENLYLDGGRWRATALPAQLAMYPLCVARVDAERYAVCVDESWPGVAAGGPGQRLFGDDGAPTEFTRRMQAALEKMEGQIDQTRAVGRRLAELDLLRQRRFDATLPDGRKIAVDGFYMVDEERVKALTDAQIVALQREGLLGLIHAHWISSGHMRRLIQWRLERERAGDGAATAAAAAPVPDAAPPGAPTH